MQADLVPTPPSSSHHHHDPCLHHGDASSSTITTHSWHSSAVVVPAIFREWGSTLPLSPPPWLTAQYPVYLYQRLNSSFPCFCLNRGYESGIILQFLVDHYTRLPAIVAFVQADWLQRARGVMGLPAPFDFWQPQCALERIDAPWHSWMPLGKRHSCWPPGHMWRNAMYWEHARSQHTHGAPSVSAALVDACWHALLGIFGQSSLSPLIRLNLTFYPYQNFVASRGQLRQHGHERYKLAHERLVINGTCLYPATQPDPRGDAFPPLHDSLAVSKQTVAKGMEHVMHAIFGGRPLDAGVSDATYASVPASRNCTLAARTFNPACVHGL